MKSFVNPARMDTTLYAGIIHAKSVAILATVTKWFPLIITAFLIMSCAGRTRSAEVKAGNYSRIISFAPSITETLFALSLGDKVIGVTSYCTYPPEAKRLPKIGGYTDPNFEMIVRLKPDLVIMLKEHVQLAGFLERNRIAYITIDNHDLPGILSSFSAIGTLCGKARQADSLIQRIKAQCAESPATGDTAPRVFLCVDRDERGGGNISRAYAAGQTTFYSDLLSAAGMKNAVTEQRIEYPQISAEGVMQMQPDIIIDASMRCGGPIQAAVVKDWASLRDVPAIKSGMVFCLSGDYMTIPGPRVFLMLKEFKKIRQQYRSLRGRES